MLVSNLVGRPCRVNPQSSLPASFEGKTGEVVAVWVSGAGLLYVAVEFEDEDEDNTCSVIVTSAANLIRLVPLPEPGVPVQRKPSAAKTALQRELEQEQAELAKKGKPVKV